MVQVAGRTVSLLMDLSSSPAGGATSFFFLLHVPVVQDAPPWARQVPLTLLYPRVDGRVAAPTMGDTLVEAVGALRRFVGPKSRGKVTFVSFCPISLQIDSK